MQVVQMQVDGVFFLNWNVPFIAEFIYLFALCAAMCLCVIFFAQRP